jgi:hypothetical protein
VDIFERLRSVAFLRDGILVKTIVEKFESLPEGRKLVFISNLIDIHRVTSKVLDVIVSKYLQDRTDAGFPVETINSKVSSHIHHQSSNPNPHEMYANINFLEERPDKGEIAFSIDTYHSGWEEYPLRHLWIDNWAGELVAQKKSNKNSNEDGEK